MQGNPEGGKGFAKLALLLSASIGAIILQAALAPLASADPPPVSVEVIPQSVELPSADGAKALVVVQNASSDTTLRNVELSSFTNNDVNVELPDEQKAKLEELAPESVHVWTLRVKQTGEGPIAGTVHSRVDYSWMAEGKTRESSQSVFKPLQITNRLASLDSVVSVEAKTSLGSGTISQQRPGTVYLVVRNISDAPVTLKGVLPKGPQDMIKFSCEDTEFVAEDCTTKGDGLSIKPYERRTVAVNVATTDRVTPGRYVLLFELPIEWGWPGAQQEGDLFASQDVSVEVFGESSLLTVFGVNVGALTLFFLPGAMAIAMWGLLWIFWPLKRPAAGATAAPFPLGTLNPSTYIVALVLSLVIVRAYTFVVRSNVFRSYGTQDLVWIAVISLLVFGVLGYLLVLGLLTLVRRQRSGPSTTTPSNPQQTPSAGDTTTPRT